MLLTSPTKSWLIWLTILLTLILGGLGLGWVILAQGYRLVGYGAGGIVLAAASFWLLYGLWQRRAVRIVRSLFWMTLGSYLIAGLFWLLWVNFWRPTAVAIAGIWAMLLCLTLGLWAIRGLLVFSHPVTGIARTLIDEAVRMKIALVFIIGLMILIPVLPMSLNPAELLNYRIKTFLGWAMSGFSSLLGLMTLFLACSSLCREIAQKQIFLTMSKPVGRGQYLLGKWLGIALLNLVLTATAGIGIYSFATILSQQPPRDELDAVAVQDQVMTARRSAAATPPSDVDLNQFVQQQITELRRSRPEIYGTDQQPKTVDAKIINDLRNQAVARWHTIAPQDRKSFLFTNLAVAQSDADSLQLRVKPKTSRASNDGQVHLAFWLNQRPWPVIQGQQQMISLNEDTFSTVTIPAQAIDEKGQLLVTIANLNLQDPESPQAYSVSFTPGEGMEVLYQSGNFSANLLRTLCIAWLELAFLAWLGILAGSFLSFPVACLFSLMIYFIGAGSWFITESLEFFTLGTPKELDGWNRIVWFVTTSLSKIAQGDLWEALKMLVRLFCGMVLQVMPTLSDFDPGRLLADGRQIPANMLTDAIWKMGLLWSGLCGLIGYAIFRKRELADANNNA